MQYRKKAFALFGRKCMVCGQRFIVEVHHRDGNRYNNNPENIPPLCPTHHRIVQTRLRAVSNEKRMAEFLDIKSEVNRLDSKITNHIADWIKNHKEFYMEIRKNPGILSTRKERPMYTMVKKLKDGQAIAFANEKEYRQKRNTLYGVAKKYNKKLVSRYNQRTGSRLMVCVASQKSKKSAKA